jgi:hypothetical protein
MTTVAWMFFALGVAAVMVVAVGLGKLVEVLQAFKEELREFRADTLDLAGRIFRVMEASHPDSIALVTAIRSDLAAMGIDPDRLENDDEDEDEFKTPPPYRTIVRQRSAALRAEHFAERKETR